jgi:hypothetical protein
MSLDLCVYAANRSEPAIGAISKLLDFAGWRWVAVTNGAPLRRAERLDRSRAIGWDASDGIGAAVESAVAAGAAEALAALGDRVCEVAIEVESPFRPDSDVISELREEGHEPDLVTRIEEAAVCYRCTVDEPATEEAVEFLWALASAVGVLTDGVLEDQDDGTLLDCTEEDGD